MNCLRFRAHRTVYRPLPKTKKVNKFQLTTSSDIREYVPPIEIKVPNFDFQQPIMYLTAPKYVYVNDLSEEEEEITKPESE